MSNLTVGMSDDWFKKEGMTRTPELWEDGSRVDNAPGRFEWWYFDAHLDDRSTVVAVIYTKPHGNINIPCTPQVKLIITGPDGKAQLNVENFKASDFHALKEKCDVKVGKNRIIGDLITYNIHFEVGGNSADLEFRRIVPSWRPGVGKCYFGEALEYYLGWFVPVPYGKVNGTIRYNGQDHNVKGAGYHDHNYGNRALPKIIDHWYWGRLKIADYNCIFFQFVAAKKYGHDKLPLFMFAKGEEIIIQDGSRLKVIEKDFIEHRSGKSYPGNLEFLWEDGGNSIAIRLLNPQLIESRYLLAELPLIKRMIARLLLNPYYFRFTADIEIEINYKNIKDIKKEKGIFESMMLR